MEAGQRIACFCICICRAPYDGTRQRCCASARQHYEWHRLGGHQPLHPLLQAALWVMPTPGLWQTALHQTLPSLGWNCQVMIQTASSAWLPAMMLWCCGDAVLMSEGYVMRAVTVLKHCDRGWHSLSPCCTSPSRCRVRSLQRCSQHVRCAGGHSIIAACSKLTGS